MYLEGVVLWGGQIMLMLLGAFVIPKIVNPSSALLAYNIFSFLVGGVIAVGSGFLANRVYYSYYQKACRQIDSTGEGGQMLLGKHGGVMKTGPFIGILIGMILISSLAGVLNSAILGSADTGTTSNTYDYSGSSSGASHTANPAYAMDDSGTTMDQEAVTEDQALTAVRESYFDNGEVETEVFDELFEVVYPGGEWETDETDSGILVGYTGEGYCPFTYGNDIYSYVFLVSGDTVDFSEVTIGDRTLLDEEIDAAFAYADACYNAIQDGKSGIMDILSTEDENPSTLEEAEYYFKSAGVGYSVRMNESGEKANMVLEDDSKLIFFANRSDYLDGMEGYILTIKDQEMNVNTFQKYFYNTEPKPDYSYFGMDSAGVISASDLGGLTQTDLYIMRNEIFALHGREFDDPFLQSVFSFTTWYTPVYAPEEFPDVLNATEKANVETIRSVEEEHGYWGDWDFW